MATALLSLVIGVLGSVIAAALFPELQAAVTAMLARRFGWLPFGQRSLFAGLWRVAWHVESDRYAPVEVDEAVQIRQWGTRLYAKFRAGSIDCYLQGTSDGGRYVTGTWYDATEGGYHGAFQLIVDPSTRVMNGLWIGFSTSGVVKSGKFEWTPRRGK